MRERTELLIRGMSEARTKRGRWLALVTALAFLTGGNVFWSLREIGTALTEDDMCTLEAHEHTESCYDESGTLICGKEEHIHTAACFSDENADLETEEIWELTLPERDGIPRQELTALIAESQLGYAESANNFIRPEDGTQQGYTRYGAWYGNPYGEWNTMFVYFCLYYAGVSTEEIPCAGNARTWQVKLTESGLVRGPDSEPERGGIVLLDLDADGAADRAGILTNTEEHLTVIEGDCGNMVAETQYATDAEQILGYVAIPNPDTPADETTAGENPPETEEAPTEETAAEAAEESGAETEPGTEMPMITYKAESESGILVSASAPPDAFPAEVTLRVTDVPHDEALQTASENLETDAEALDAVAVDISFIDAAGTEMEPALDKSVQVQISLPEELYLSGNEYNLLHVSDEGEVQEVADAAVNGTGAEFAAESFSMYIVTSSGTNLDLNTAMTINGQSVPNSSTNPFILSVNEKIKVRYEDSDYSQYNLTVDGNDPQGSNVNYHYINRTGYTPTGANYIEGEWEGAHEGLCRIVRKRNDNEIVEEFWVRVVDRPIFLVENGNRTLFEGNSIVRNVGDTFTLSVNGARNDLIVPTGDNSPEAYEMPGGFLHRGKTDYSNGNTTVTFVCKKTAVNNGTTNNVQTINVNGRDIAVTINNDHLYKVENGNRNLIDYGTTIYADVNDTFTLSVNDRANHRLVPNGSSEDEYIIEGDYIKRGNTEYGTISVNDVSVETTNVTFTCLKAGPASLKVNNKTVNVEIFDSYLILDGERMPIIDALNHLNNSNAQKIYLLEGETCTFSLDGTNQGDQFSVADSNIVSKGTPVNGDHRTDVTFTAHKHGITTVKVNDRPFEIVVEHPMYVKTATIERDFDRINEWLAIYAAGTKKNGYHPNANEPYLLYDGDTVSLRVPKGELTNAHLEISQSDTAGLTVRDGNLTLPTGASDINVTLTGHNTTDTDAVTTEIKLVDDSTNTVLRTMKVKILKRNHSRLDHADIEIADGGKYTVTKLKRNADGTYSKTVVEYAAYVTGVNYSKLYSSTDNSTTCQFYYKTKINDNEVYEQHSTDVTGYVNYYVDPRYHPGDPQYEFTSKYEPVLNNGVITYENWSNRWYYASDVDHVLFDVQLGLLPTKETQYTKTDSGWVEGTSTEIHANQETDLVTLPSVKFIMDHQSVLDAYNKCPNHTGLDFTVMAFSAMVEFDLNKELTGGTVADKQFSFEVLQKAVVPSRKGYGTDTTLKTNYQELTDKGLNFKGAYRVFYHDGTTFQWGEGIDYEAALRELNTIPEFQNKSVGDIFNIANNNENPDQQKRMLRILQQYLTTPAAVTETTTEYQLPQDGFYLLAFESDPIQTVQNDENGLVTFNALHFEKAGDYNYIIREVRNGTASESIIYDLREVDLKISVDERYNQLQAEIDSDLSTFEFNNILITYRLPDTGGSGTLPYYLGGTALLAASALLFMKKRRKGS